MNQMSICLISNELMKKRFCGDSYAGGCKHGRKFDHLFILDNLKIIENYDLNMQNLKTKTRNKNVTKKESK